MTDNHKHSDKCDSGDEPAAAAMAPALLIASGWKDDLHAYRDLIGELTDRGWRTAIVALPQESEALQTRRHHLSLLEASADELFGRTGPHAPGAGLRCLLGFSYGGYMGVLLSRTRKLDAIVLRSPAMYGDSGWDVPKDELDEQNIATLREEDLGPAANMALAAASEFSGDVVLFEAELDKVVPHQTHINYHRAFSSRHPCQWEVLRGAGHALENPAHRAEFFRKAGAWLTQLQDRAKGHAEFGSSRRSFNAGANIA